jgi:hypothetical protein
MKHLKKNKPLLLVLALSVLFSTSVLGQEDSAAAKEIVKLHYYNSNNNLQWLLLESLLKKGKKTEPQQNKVFKIFLDKDQSENLITKVVTDKNGKAKAIIPPQLKTIWDSAAQHTFFAIAEETDKEEQTRSEITVTKSKLSIDTSSAEGIKNISVKVMKYENNSWVPVKDVEMKIGVERSGGILPAGDEESYTTDSTGIATTGFKKINLPGDEQGDFLLIAKVEDNDELGNLIIEKQVQWGIATKQDDGFFNQRTLWSTRFKTPLWLLLMAYSIVIGVWGTIIYLISLLIKIKRTAVSAA